MPQLPFRQKEQWGQRLLDVGGPVREAGIYEPLQGVLCGWNIQGRGNKVGVTGRRQILKYHIRQVKEFEFCSEGMGRIFLKKTDMIGLHFQKDHSGSFVENKLATYCSKLCKKQEGPRHKQWQYVQTRENQVYRPFVSRSQGFSRLEARMQASVTASGIWANATGWVTVLFTGPGGRRGGPEVRMKGTQC